MTNWFTSWFAPKEVEDGDVVDLQTAIESHKIIKNETETMVKNTKKQAHDLIKMSENALAILDRIERKKA